MPVFPPGSPDEITNRFTYHGSKPGQTARYEEIRDTIGEVALMLGRLCPQSRELSIAFTKLEEAVMWANAAIARNE